MNGRPAYRNEGDADWWCCFGFGDRWNIQRKGSAIGSVRTLVGREPWARGVKWRESVNGEWVERSPEVSGVLMTEVLGPGMRSGGEGEWQG